MHVLEASSAPFLLAIRARYVHATGTLWARSALRAQYVHSTCTQWARNRHVVRYVNVPRNGLCYVHVLELVYAQVTHYNASSYTGRFHRPVSRRGVIGSERVRVVLVTVDMLNHDREDAKVPGAEAT